MNHTEHKHQFGKIIADNGICGKRIQLVRKCTVCGYIEHVGTLGTVSPHRFSGPFILKKSTCMNNGRAFLKCEQCGYTKQIILPRSVHHYERSGPFYKTCRNCRKKLLTPLAKRMLMISATALLTGVIAAFGIYLLSTHFHHKTVHSLKTAAVVYPETETRSSAPHSVNEAGSADMKSSEHHISNTSEESPKTHASAEYSVSHTEISSSAVVESTVIPSTAANLYETFSETTSPSMTAISQQNIMPPQTITTQSETQTEVSEKQSETAFTKDYSWLIGEIINGSDLLELIKTGAPIEIITNIGTNFSMNIDISDTVRLWDTDMISAADSYIADVIYIDHQQIIIMSQF